MWLLRIPFSLKKISKKKCSPLIASLTSSRLQAILFTVLFGCCYKLSLNFFYCWEWNQGREESLIDWEYFGPLDAKNIGIWKTSFKFGHLNFWVSRLRRRHNEFSPLAWSLLCTFNLKFCLSEDKLYLHPFLPSPTPYQKRQKKGIIKMSLTLD